MLIFSGDESRRRRGHVDIQWRRVGGDAAAATWIFLGVESAPRLLIFRGDDSLRRRGCDVDILWRRVAAAPRPRRKHSVDAALWSRPTLQLGTSTTRAASSRLQPSRSRRTRTRPRGRAAGPRISRIWQLCGRRSISRNGRLTEARDQSRRFPRTGITRAPPRVSLIGPSRATGNVLARARRAHAHAHALARARDRRRGPASSRSPRGSSSRAADS